MSERDDLALLVGSYDTADAVIAAGWVRLGAGVDLDNTISVLTEVLQPLVPKPRWSGYGTAAADAAEAVVAALKGMVV